jgi:hypothetical protein
MYVSTATSATTTMNHNASLSSLPLAVGGINPRWQGKEFNQGIEKVKWAPKVLGELPTKYYMLEDDVVLVPFHSFAGHNVGHLLWDDFLPIYTLLQIFGFLEKDDASSSYDYRPLLIRLDTLPTLYASCEIRRNKKSGCAQNFHKFLPLMGIDPNTFTTLKEVQLTTNNNNKNPDTSIPICARHAVAGLGMLTDHGLKDHGWEPLATDAVHNVGKGPQLYQFRNFMIRNMGLPVVPPSLVQQQQFHILLNAHSSRDAERDFGLEEQHRVLTAAFPTTRVSVVKLSDYTLQEQVELVSQRTNIFVSTCGGGSMTAFFLPRGASLILYYAEKSGFNFDKFALTGGPAILDWDLFNNVGYLRVHWLPIGTMNTQEGLEALMYLIRHEMDVALHGMI